MATRPKNRKSPKRDTNTLDTAIQIATGIATAGTLIAGVLGEVRSQKKKKR